MRRVLNALYEERFGGPQSHVLQVAPGLRRRGVETIVVIPRGDPTFASLLREARVPFHELDLVRLRDTWNPAVHARFLARFWPNVAALRRLIREHHVEIVHTNGLMNLQAAIAARLEGARLIWYLHDTYSPKLVRLMFLPLVQSWADRIAIAAQAVGRYYFPDPFAVEGRLHLIYAPVDTGRFNPAVDGSAVRAELGIGGDCPVVGPVVGTVANLSPGKGVEFLLEAAPYIRHRFPETKFMVAGRPLENRRTYWRFLQRRTEELGLTKDVVFAGCREDMPQVMGAMTVYVQPSESEACPMAVLEASASGLPVVATDVGGTRELVTHGVTGLLIEPRQPHQIAEAVIRLLDRPDAARSIGMAGAERIRRLFSLDACVAAHARLYSEVLGKGAASKAPIGVRKAPSASSVETPCLRA